MEFRFEYRFSKAIAFLHKFVIWCEEQNARPDASGKSPEQSQKGLGFEKRSQYEAIVLIVCYLECSKRLIDVEDVMDIKKVMFDPNICDPEWDIIDGC